MRIRFIIASAATATLLAGAAYAQSSSVQGDTAVNPPSSSQLPAGVATGNAATNTQPSGQAGSGDSTAPSAAAPSPGLNSSDAASVAPAAGPPAQRAPAASAGTDLVSNGPVPDTPANRAKYGQPMSHAGKLTKPAGN